MAGILDLLGVNQQGLGSAVAGLQAMETQDLAQQQGLAQLMQAERQNRAADIQAARDLLTLDAERQLQPSKIAAGISGNEALAGEASLKKQQQLGQMLTQFGPAMDRIPVAQRAAFMQQLAQRIPGIADDPVYQQLAATDPNELPGAIRGVGMDILLNTGEQLRSLELQRQKDEAAMARTQAQEAGANARQGAALSNARALEQMRIDAGKYQKRQQGIGTIMDIAGKAGYEKAATAAYLMSQDRTASEEDRQFYANMANELAEANVKARSAGAVPKPVLDPTSPTGIGYTDPYGQQGGTTFGQPQVAPPDQRDPNLAKLPQGSQALGDGMYKLPDGRIVRAKK